MRYPPCTITVSPFRARISQVLPPDLLNHTSTTPATRRPKSLGRVDEPSVTGGAAFNPPFLPSGLDRCGPFV